MATKYCPTCKSTFTDETLAFCTLDGQTLVTDETETRVLPPPEDKDYSTKIISYKNEGDVLRDILRRYKSTDRLFIAPAIDQFRLATFQRKLQSKCPQIARKLDYKNVLLFYDTAVLNRGRAGCVITTNSFFSCTFHDGTCHCYPLREIRAVRRENGPIKIMFDDLKETDFGIWTKENSLLNEILQEFLIKRALIPTRPARFVRA